jgi:hypothetical protein
VQRPKRTRHGASETKCVVSYDGGKTYETFVPKRKQAKTSIVRTQSGEWIVVENKPR